jgi:hypothetical protein
LHSGDSYIFGIGSLSSFPIWFGLRDNNFKPLGYMAKILPRMTSAIAIKLNTLHAGLPPYKHIIVKRNINKQLLTRDSVQWSLIVLSSFSILYSMKSLDFSATIDNANMITFQHAKGMRE